MRPAAAALSDCDRNIIGKLHRHEWVEFFFYATEEFLVRAHVWWLPPAKNVDHVVYYAFVLFFTSNKTIFYIESAKMRMWAFNIILWRHPHAQWNVQKILASHTDDWIESINRQCVRLYWYIFAIWKRIFQRKNLKKCARICAGLFGIFLHMCALCSDTHD